MQAAGPYSIGVAVLFYDGPARRAEGLSQSDMAVVAQLVEPSVVVRVVAGSSPVDRPMIRHANVAFLIEAYREEASPNKKGGKIGANRFIYP